jgi:hypothetical protein
MTSEFERMINLANRLFAFARAMDSNVAVVQQTREEVSAFATPALSGSAAAKVAL